MKTRRREEEEEEEEDQRRKRVVGVLLGSVTNGRLDVTSSFAVPFEEDPADASIWFLDHAYAEQMYRMMQFSNPTRKKKSGGGTDGPRSRERSRYRRTVRKVLRRSGVGDCELVADGRTTSA